MCDTTLQDLKQLKDPFIWCSANGAVIVADNGVPVESFNDSVNWIRIWVEKIRDMGYNVNGWKIMCNGTTTKVNINGDEIILEKV